MKWKRERTGKYTAGDFTITGKGVKWKLTYNGETLGKFSGKKLAQEAAEKHQAEENEPEEPAPPQKEQFPLQGDNLIETLRLDISNLHFQVIALTDAIQRLTELLEKADD